MILVSQNSTPERLQKIIARSGLASRRAAEEMIGAGRVTVDGVVARLGQKADGSQVTIMIDGILLPTTPGLVYYLLSKPLDVVSTASDTHHRRTVVDMVPAEPRVFPVGRLDADTTGQILLTNDGELTNVVTHPRYGVSKTYVALVSGVPSGATLRGLVSGVELDDGPARASSARLVGKFGGKAHIEMVMGEGRNREVRRLCDAVGHRVIELHRVAIGPIRDRQLKVGEWRPLTIAEVRALYAAGGKPRDDLQAPGEDSAQ